MIGRGVIFGFLEQTGREVTGGRQELSLQQVFEAYGGRGSGATRRIADQLGVSQRQVQRIIAGETGTARQTRGFGPKSVRYFRDLSTRELRRAGARALRDRPLVFSEDSTFALCYGDEKQGKDREIRGDQVSIDDNSYWLDHFDAGASAEDRRDMSTAEREYEQMRARFTDAFLEAYGVSSGELDVCDEDEGENLALAR